MMNRTNFLTTIGYSEGTIQIPNSDNGYRVIVGSTIMRPFLMDGYHDHPRIKVRLRKLGINSTAAGRYQILERYYDAYKKLLRLNDFGPAAQDKIALQMIKECHALDDIDAGRISVALVKCNDKWASLPGADYGQHENKLADLLTFYSDLPTVA
jgi:muramidase (phage lysozyme)